MRAEMKLAALHSTCGLNRTEVPAGLYITDWQLMEGLSVNAYLWLLLSVFFSHQLVVMPEWEWWEKWWCWRDQLCPDDPERKKQQQLVGGEESFIQQWLSEESQQVHMTPVWTALGSAPLSHTMSSPTSISKYWGPGFLVLLTALPTAPLDLTRKETNATLRSSSKNTITLKSHLLYPSIYKLFVHYG